VIFQSGDMTRFLLVCGLAQPAEKADRCVFAVGKVTRCHHRGPQIAIQTFGTSFKSQVLNYLVLAILPNDCCFVPDRDASERAAAHVLAA